MEPAAVELDDAAGQDLVEEGFPRPPVELVVPVARQLLDHGEV